jgi:photosystem II stability/assembly factor-like uncharacterized protein
VEQTEPGGLQLHHIHGLAVDPGDAAIVYIATHAGLVKGTGDTDWQFVGDDRSDFMGFTVHPMVPGLMVASGHPAEGSQAPNPRGLMVSRDGGRTWRPLTLEGIADFHALTLSRADGDTLYGWNVGRNPGLYRVSLRTGTWRRVDARGLGEVYALSAHPRERETVVAGTRSGLLVSRDGGQSWDSLGTALRGVTVTAVAFHPETLQVLVAYAVHPELGLVQSLDGGLTWTSLGWFLGRDDAVSHVAFSRAASTIYLATFSSDVYRSADGGRRWQRLIHRGQPVQSR